MSDARQRFVEAMKDWPRWDYGPAEGEYIDKEILIAAVHAFADAVCVGSGLQHEDPDAPWYGRPECEKGSHGPGHTHAACREALEKEVFGNG